MPTRDQRPPGIAVLGRPVDLGRRGQPRLLQRALRLGGPGAEPGVRRLLHVPPRRGAGGRRHGRHGRHEGQRHLEDLPAHRRHRQDAGGGDGGGAQVIAPAMAGGRPRDPGGAHRPHRGRIGAWQPGTFPGFTVLGEHGSPSWFELFTRTTTRALDFYRSVFRWDTEAVGDSDEFRYSVMRNPDGEGELAGIMDAAGFLPEGVPAHWSIYWEVDDADAAVATVTKLGGSVVAGLEDTPYGRMATVTDPAGAQFKLHAASE